MNPRKVEATIAVAALAVCLALSQAQAKGRKPENTNPPATPNTTDSYQGYDQGNRPTTDNPTTGMNNPGTTNPAGAQGTVVNPGGTHPTPTGASDHSGRVGYPGAAGTGTTGTSGTTR